MIALHCSTFVRLTLLAIALPVASSAADATAPTAAAPATEAASPSGAAGAPAMGRPALPRWEWGVGLAAAHLRDYPGSSHSGTYALPVPWFIWRSDRVEVGREGGRGVIYRSAQRELDFTLMANPPADIDDNPERAGMESLDPVLEPGLRMRWRFPLGDWRLGVQLPVRYALSVGDHFRSDGLGLHVEPGVSVDRALMPGWAWSMSLAAGFAEADYSDYYYGVSPADATAQRPAYAAPGGYAGWLASTRLSWRSGNFSAGGFLRYEHVGDASFSDSPLVTKNHGVTLGANATWRLGQSRDSVPSLR
jgi:outer membrane protein